MNFIANKLRWIGLLLLVGFTTVAAGLYFDLPARTPKAKPALATSSAKYVCPMHPEVVSAKPGDCPKCGMALVPAANSASAKAESAHSGCGASGASEPRGCCGSAEQAPLVLPPGHPPIPDMTAHASCGAAAGMTSSNTNASK